MAYKWKFRLLKVLVIIIIFVLGLLSFALKAFTIEIAYITNVLFFRIYESWLESLFLRYFLSSSEKEAKCASVSVFSILYCNYIQSSNCIFEEIIENKYAMVSKGAYSWYLHVNNVSLSSCRHYTIHCFRAKVITGDWLYHITEHHFSSTAFFVFAEKLMFSRSENEQ